MYYSHIYRKSFAIFDTKMRPPGAARAHLGGPCYKKHQRRAGFPPLWRLDIVNGRNEIPFGAAKLKNVCGIFIPRSMPRILTPCFGSTSRKYRHSFL